MVWDGDGDGDGGWGGVGGWMDGLWLCFCVLCGSVALWLCGSLAGVGQGGRPRGG